MHPNHITYLGGMRALILILILILCMTQRSNALLTFLSTHQVELFQSTTVHQVKLKVAFTPLDKTFLSTTNNYVDEQLKLHNASTPESLTLLACKVHLTEIDRIYENIYTPSKIFDIPDSDILTAEVNFASTNFAETNQLPIENSINEITKEDPNYDILNFNLFRFTNLLSESYEKYKGILTGTLSVSVIKGNFQKKLKFLNTDRIKLEFISAGKNELENFAIYSVEILKQKNLIQCFSVLEIANLTLPQPNLCEYNNAGITFIGNSPFSPLNIIVQYPEEDWKKIRGENMEDILPYLVPIQPQPFSTLEAGSTNFKNNMAGLKYNFQKKESFSPIITAKEMLVKIGSLIMNFKSKKKNDKIISNDQDDNKLRQLIDEAFDFFPQEIQYVLIIAGIVIILIISSVFIGLRCRRTHQNNKRKKRERNQIRTVNFLAFPHKKPVNV